MKSIFERSEKLGEQACPEFLDYLKTFCEGQASGTKISKSFRKETFISPDSIQRER